MTTGLHNSPEPPRKCLPLTLRADCARPVARTGSFLVHGWARRHVPDPIRFPGGKWGRMFNFTGGSDAKNAHRVESARCGLDGCGQHSRRGPVALPVAL